MPTKVTPKIPTGRSEFVGFDDLKPGECFIVDGELWMVTDYGDPVAVSLVTGKLKTECCDFFQSLLPVDVKIKWRRPKVTKKSESKWFLCDDDSG